MGTIQEQITSLEARHEQLGEVMRAAQLEQMEVGRQLNELRLDATVEVQLNDMTPEQVNAIARIAAQRVGAAQVEATAEPVAPFTESMPQ